MKINAPAFELLAIFEKELRKKESIRYNFSQDVDPNSHIRLEQDESVEYYAWKIAGVFIKSPRRFNYDISLNWQIRETYRILNTALASSNVSEKVKQDLLALKTKLEETPYLKTLLFYIDQGITPTQLVISGHGVWYDSDGVVDLKKYDSTVMLISGMGASLSNELAKDIENNQFNPEEVVVVKKDNDTEPVSHINAYPRFFNRLTPVTEVPDFCLVDDKESLPKPRVIEPYTMRVFYDLKIHNTKRNYFRLSNVLERFNGTSRLFAWSGCTGVRDDDENKSGEFFGYRWSNKEEVRSRKRKLQEKEEDMNKRQKTDHTEEGNNTQEEDCSWQRTYY
ncbi:putative adhesin [Legionella brunensis]|uniref:Uncharacterized protein n=1 Tax=Legionella brunensis TaxID=29422 RepID=A0A0W0SE46_9GAMM|nr:hypothetical protein [Legionella brunensis]KTC81655.1 hypothetical protein Lbru_2175 [Legionella brunensis]